MLLPIIEMLLVSDREAQLERENFFSELEKIPQREQEAEAMVTDKSSSQR